MDNITRCLRNKDIPVGYLRRYYKSGNMTILKLHKKFIDKVVSGDKVYEFRKARTLNQTGWVAIHDSVHGVFVMFLYLERMDYNPVLSKQESELVNSEGGYDIRYFAGECNNEICKESYDFVKENYVGIKNFIMFHIERMILW